MMKQTITTTVLIIGAGPAGLTLSAHLNALQIDSIVIEKSDQIGFSWKNMPDHLHLITQWHSNYLLESDKEKFPRDKTHSAKEFSHYLENLAQVQNLNIYFKVEMLSLNKRDTYFEVLTNDFTFKSIYIVDARGYFSFPYIPNFLKIEPTVKMIHFKDYINSDQLIPYKKILIVGSRLSAGQLVSELKEGHELYLSARSKIKYSAPLWFFNHYLKFLSFYESLILFFSKDKKKSLDVPMSTSVRETIEKEVKVVGEIESIDQRQVTFKNGVKIEVDVIIFATGFTTPVELLKNDFESEKNANYFYLGRGSQRNFKSRFLRGIREDAKVLAKLISGRVASKNRLQ